MAPQLGRRERRKQHRHVPGRDFGPEPVGKLSLLGADALAHGRLLSSQGHATLPGSPLWERQEVSVAHAGEPGILHPQQALQPALH